MAANCITKRRVAIRLSAYICLYSLSVYHRVPYKSGTR
nr:MAG TPA: hypothetical protein [Caudoviricetes sp.]